MRDGLGTAEPTAGNLDPVPVVTVQADGVDEVLDHDGNAFDSQVPWGVEALGGVATYPAWRTKPSWYLVATDDHMIPPPAQRAMAERAGASVTETPGSHAVYVSNPAAVAAVIAQAAAGLASQ